MSDLCLFEMCIVVSNVRRKLFNRRLFGAVHVQRLELAAEESAMHKRARELELNRGGGGQ